MLKFKKLLSVLMVAIMMFSLFNFFVSAEGITIKVDSKDKRVDTEFSVTVKFEMEKLGALSDATINYDANRLKFLSASSPNGGVANKDTDGNIILSYFDATGVGSTNDVTFEIKFKAKAVGEAKVSAKGIVENADFSANASLSKSATVKILSEVELSDNANLKTMVLSNDIPFTPEFNGDVTEYTVNVDNSVEKVLINAVQEDHEAKVTYGGSTKMKVGKNQRWVIVTAPDGTQKKYTLTIYRAAPDGTTNDPEVNSGDNPYEVEIEGEKWILAEEYTADIIPEGFTEASARVNGVELPLLKSDTSNALLVYATKGEDKTYFLYNSLTGIFSPYLTETPNEQPAEKPNENQPEENAITIDSAVLGKNALLELSADVVAPRGYYKDTVSINGHKLSVLKYDDPAYSDFILVFAQTEAATREYFRIDVKNGTMQRYPEINSLIESAKLMASGSLVKKFVSLNSAEKIMICTTLLALAIIFALIVILIIKIARAYAYKKEQEMLEFEEFMDYEDEDFEEQTESEENE